ncbi:MAG: hypothetical protein MRZ16_06185 [Parvimonas sp.]|uniref:hypothetical protein n=1 Tax=Parvimonas sp. TaxID=1944660 RepID=UPI0025D666AA|nr:hypothetical protein [Parvimonas sp.]MCI5997791.1 hypothetical protein [Parvimonas sp.]
MKKILKFFSLTLFLLIFLSACKSADKNNVSVEKLVNKQFETPDRGYVYFGFKNGSDLMVRIKYPDYCWNKNSGTIVDKEGNVFKKLDKDSAFEEAFFPKIEVKNGKKYINADSKFYPNDRFELRDEFTILDTLLGIEYVDIKGKYSVEIDENEYPNEYRETKELAEEYKNSAEAFEKHKNKLSPKVKDAIEREMNINKTVENK